MNTKSEKELIRVIKNRRSFAKMEQKKTTSPFSVGYWEATELVLSDMLEAIRRLKEEEKN